MLKTLLRREPSKCPAHPLEVTDARVQAIGEVQNYTTVVNGRRFGVYERRF